MINYFLQKRYHFPIRQNGVFAVPNYHSRRAEQEAGELKTSSRNCGGCRVDLPSTMKSERNLTCFIIRILASGYLSSSREIIQNITEETKHSSTRPIPSVGVLLSYQKAVADCKKQCEKLLKECLSGNLQHRDSEFDIEFDLLWQERAFLQPLGTEERAAYTFEPKAVKRVRVG